LYIKYFVYKYFLLVQIHIKNDFADGFKILLDTDLKIILLDHQNNFVGKIMEKILIILITSLSVYIILIVQQNYVERSN